MKIKALFILLFVIKCSLAQETTKDRIAVLLENYQYDSALLIIEQYERADTIDYSIQKGHALKGLNRYNRAWLVYTELYEKDSTSLQVIIELANCYKQLGNINEAIKVLLNGKVIYPDNTYLNLQLANNYYKLEAYKTANRYYHSLYASDTINHFLLQQIARSYDKLNMIDSAIYFFQKVFLVNKSDYQSVFRLANLFIKKENVDMARVITAEFVKSDSLNTPINRLYAYLIYLHKDFEYAIKKFRYCMSLEDTTIFVQKFLGLSYFKIDSFENAKPFLEKVYLSDTLNTEMLYYYAQSCVKSNNVEEGIYFLKKLIDLIMPAPESMSELYQQLANAYNANKKPEDALEALIQAKKIAPNDKLILFKIARQYDVEMDDSKDKALKYYEDFLAKRPPQSDTIKHFGSGVEINFFNYTEERIFQLKEELFWEEE